MLDSINLKKCPVCGGVPEMENSHCDISIHCTNCGFTLSGFEYDPEDKSTKDDAILMAIGDWNQMKP